MLKGKKLLLIDGHGLVYRAYYALESTGMTTSSGIKNWAVYGFINLLTKAIDEQKPDYLAISFDLSAPTVRLEQFSDYKGQRKETPDDFKAQLPYILKFVDALNIQLFLKEGYEADDCIATLCKKGEKEGACVYILSGDTDLFQLISNQTKVLYPDRGAKQLQPYDEEAVVSRYGLTSKQLVDFKALQGDSSDNIPGVPGIGKVTATKLLQQFTSLDNIFLNIDDVKPERIKNILINNKDKAFESQKLVKLYSDLDLNVQWDKCLNIKPDNDKLSEFFHEMEFKVFIEKYGLKIKKREEPLCETITVNNRSSFSDLIEDLKSSDEVCVNCFSYNGPSLYKSLLSLGFTTVRGNYYIPFPYKPVKYTDEKKSVQGLLFDEPERENYESSLDTEYILNGLKPFLESKSLKKYGFNLKEIYIQLSGYGIKLNGLDFDVQLASFLLDSERPEPSLSYIVSRYLSVDIPEWEEIIGKGKNISSLESLSEETLKKCSSRITSLSYKLVKILREDLEKNNLFPLFYDIEMPLIPVLARIEMRGIYIDRSLLRTLSIKAEEELKKLAEEIYTLGGERFNINSPKQLGDILFNKLQIPGGTKTKTGYSTSSEVLEPLRDTYKITGLVLDYRELTKLKTTYLDVLPDLIDPLTGKLHTHLNQMITATGRLSSSEPNLQNIPVRTELGRVIRKAFERSSEGKILLAADYSQIELRIFAHYSNSEKLLRAFLQNRDIHTETARDIFEVPDGEMPSDAMRRIAKTVNFGIIYGISDFGLARNLLIEKKEAKKYIDSYFEKFPGVKNYIDDVIEDAKQKGFVSTIMGRKRRVSKINDSNFNVRKSEERIAVNAPIQGSAADIIKKAMILIDKEIEEKNLKSYMVLQVHDELIFELPEEEKEELYNLIKEKMEHAFELTVPLIVDVKAGNNWYDMEKFKI